MAGFIYGVNTVIYSILTTIMLLIYAYLMVPIVKRAFDENLRNKWTALFETVLLAIVAIFISIPLPDGSYLIPFPVNYYIIFYAGVWLLVVGISTKIGKTKGEESDRRLLEGIDKAATNGENVDIHNFNYKKELRRKLIHMASSLYLLAYILAKPIFELVVKYVYSVNAMNYGWEEFYNTCLLGSGEAPTEVGLALITLAFIGSFIVQADAEIMRLRSPDTPFILKKTLQKTRRVTETKTFGAHIAMVVAFMASHIILTYSPECRVQGANALAAIVTTSSLADMMAAIIGRKWGKTKCRVNKNKSYIGCFAGGLTAFLLSYWFVGLILAIVTVFVFLFADLILAKVNLSDNLTYPLTLAIVYRILIAFVSPVLPAMWYAIPLSFIP